MEAVPAKRYRSGLKLPMKTLGPDRDRYSDVSVLPNTTVVSSEAAHDGANEAKRVIVPAR